MDRQRRTLMKSPCQHPKPVVKKYVGSTDTYMFCPCCYDTWGGEETPAKKALIRGAAEAEERRLTPDDLVY